ncbi:MAG TPA: DUF2125 domain-containing protein [Xanthobacteraceae bacterium]|jgi:hypothetical protein|nr:DUF2125 domain-containing protein [Xanthobacteraceae bacterium]
MAGQSPMSMMRPRPLPRRTAPSPRKRRLWLFVLVALVLLAAGWTALWYYAAHIAGQAEAGWIAREAALGRVYACSKQGIGGFPFSIVSRCNQAAATFKSTNPPFDLRATDVTFSAQVFRPTVLNGDITGPVTLADPGQRPAFVANFSDARLSLFGLPTDPQAITVAVQKPRLDRVLGPRSGMIFQAEAVDVAGRIISGSARSNPVIEATGHFAGATAPTFHPLLADPLQGDVDFVLRGFSDFSPKPWPALFREMAASGGGIEIKWLRIDRPDATIIGTGTLTVNAEGKLDGALQVSVAGIDNVVPRLGIDQLIGQGIDRLTGGSGSADQGLNALDRLMPGLGGVVRQSAASSVLENIKKMGQPTEIDKNPALALPVRVNNGVISLGIIPLGIVPPLF